MPEFITRYLNKLAEFWKSLEKSQKTRLYITSAIVAVAIGISIIMISRPNHITLFSNEDKKQVGEMVAILNDNNIWNSAEDSGTSIVINAKDNNRAQILLAQQGYPKGGMTFQDAISMIGITTTESDKKHIWKQQQISDLEAKIKMLDNVEEAAVSLATPESSVFAPQGQEPPKATAYVMVKPKQQLTEKQVEGIVMLVSRSVEKLDPEYVTVVDGNGNILNTNTGDGTINVVNSQEEMRVGRERELEQKVLNYFSVGQYDNFDTLRVVANVVLDFDKDKASIKSITNPQGMEGGAVISSKTEEERIKNGAASGEPGQTVNPGNAETPSYVTGDTGSSDYSNKKAETNFGYDETLREQEKAVGKLVPEESSLAISLWYGKKVTDDTKIGDDFINQVKQAASTATGIPIGNISVTKLKMAQPEVVEKTLNETIRQLVSDYGFFALMLFLIAGLLIMAMPRRKKEPEVETAQPLAAAAGGPKFVVPDAAEPLPEIELEERSEIKKQIDKFVKQKPDAVAQLLRNWLSDEWDS
jgi:flagellar M-ring protein FliF